MFETCLVDFCCFNILYHYLITMLIIMIIIVIIDRFLFYFSRVGRITNQSGSARNGRVLLGNFNVLKSFFDLFLVSSSLLQFIPINYMRYLSVFLAVFFLCPLNLFSLFIVCLLLASCYIHVILYFDYVYIYIYISFISCGLTYVYLFF